MPQTTGVGSPPRATRGDTRAPRDAQTSHDGRTDHPPTHPPARAGTVRPPKTAAKSKIKVKNVGEP